MPGDDVKQIVAANLRALLDYAADHDMPYCDAKSVGKKAGNAPPPVI